MHDDAVGVGLVRAALIRSRNNETDSLSDRISSHCICNMHITGNRNKNEDSSSKERLFLLC